jgi:carbon-monoxide dehydrogenase large subunit
MATTKTLGVSVARREDPRLLRGEGQFVDDIRLPGTVHAAFVRSPHGHARIVGIDLSAARAMPGVLGAYTCADLWSDSAPQIGALKQTPGQKVCPQLPLAHDKVRFVGEAVAVIVAESRAVAEDAVETVEVTYDVLDAVTEVNAAMSASAPELHDSVPGNVAARWTQSTGDVDAAFQRADRIISDTYRMQRYSGIPMETRGILVARNALNDELTIWPSGQWPYIQRDLTAAHLGLNEGQIHVIHPDVGGGFGIKLDLYPEDLVIPRLAQLIDHPIKWIEDRQEHMLTAIHSRQMEFKVEMAVANDGQILGLKVQAISDNGAYMRALGPGNVSLAICGLPGPYYVPHYRAEALCVLTNKSPTSAYRGAGSPEAAFARERLFDKAAQELGIDPAAFRLKNLITPDKMPYATGLVSLEATNTYDSGDFPRALREALDRFGYESFRAGQPAERTAGKLRGVGICAYTQMAGVTGFESAGISVDKTGLVTLVSGAAPNGQGHVTMLSQIVADAFEIPIEQVKVVFSDSGRLPAGSGTYGSRSAAMGGNAAHGAAVRVLDKAHRMAALLFQAPVEDIRWADGGAYVAGAPDNRIALKDLATQARPGGTRPADMDPGLDAIFYYETDQTPFAYGVHIVGVELDPETFDVSIDRYVVVADCGTIINPLMVEGQVVGGIAQGVGGALFEEFVYDETGQMLNASLLDYKLPTSLELPMIEIHHIETPSPVNPLGVKGTAEGGAIAGHAAVANAVADAIAHLGAEVRATPLTPSVIHGLIHAS